MKTFCLHRITIFSKGHCLCPVKTLSFVLTLLSTPYFLFTLFMVLWLPKVEFVIVLIAEFTTLMINLEGLHLYEFTVRLTVKILWHKRSFQCSRLVSYYSFLSSCHCEKGKNQFGRKCKTITFSSKPCFLKCYQPLVAHHSSVFYCYIIEKKKKHRALVCLYFLRGY